MLTLNPQNGCDTVELTPNSGGFVDLFCCCADPDYPMNFETCLDEDDVRKLRDYLTILLGEVDDG